MSVRRVVVVDDDPKMRTLLRRCLEGDGFEVDEAESAAALNDRLAERAYQLITLDLALPDGDGFEVAKAIRQRCTTPIIMVTGKGEVFDRVVGLEVGADDYIAKPFHVREFLARTRAVLRRGAQTAADDGEDGYVLDDLRVFPARRAVVDASGSQLALTTREYDLLFALIEANGRALSRDALIDSLAGADASPFDRTVDNAVARLRKHLPEGTIKTVRSVGYQLGVPARARRLHWLHRG